MDMIFAGKGTVRKTLAAGFLIVQALVFGQTPANDTAPSTTAGTYDAGETRQRILLDAGWRFRLGDPADVTKNVTDYPEIAFIPQLQRDQVSGPGSETYYEGRRVDIFAARAGEDVSFVQTDYDDSIWRRLDLPHDWAVELPFDSSAERKHGYKAIGDPKFGPNNIGWYRRTFTLPASDAGKKIWLEFDGVFRNCLVWLNGHILGRNVSGYTSFYFDATAYVHPGGANVLVVRVDASRFEGWWYEGAGIYRHVWLTKVNPVHVAPWGTFVYTSALSDSNATVTIETEVTNQGGTDMSHGALTSTIVDAEGRAVADVTSTMDIPAGRESVIKQTLSFAANPWSLETPYLYTLVTTVKNRNAVTDVYTTPFGVRTVSIDPDRGVFLNGRHVEIKGMCNHQDHAGVGVALPDRLQYYRIERLKQMGVNAYRAAHNMPTAELLDACDRLGMLVMDENRRIGTNAEPMSQLTRLIRRDRNHPSVFMWSLGNEEPLQGTSIGADMVRTMQDAVHALDPTRRCTIAMNGSWGRGFSTVIDVQGFNYFLGNIDKFHSSFPKQCCIGTEISSITSDRGVYVTDPPNGFVWAYDTINGDPAETWWPFYHARPWASGAFSWTGFDYRGEPTPYSWPNINSHFGTLDMCGFPKDNFYYYQANWTHKPVLHVFPHWNWQTPGQPINVWVFGNCQAVELFVNDVSLGRKSLDVLGRVEWDVPYAPGALRAVGYRYDEPVLTETIVTTGAPAGIRLTPDRTTILADGRDVSVVTVAVLDERENLVPTAMNEINFSVKGGMILGVGNGNPSCHEPDKAERRSVFNGLAQVLVQSSSGPGPITLTATSPGLKSTQVFLAAASILPPPAAPTGAGAVGGNGRVAVNWDIVPGATTYNVLRSTIRGGPYAPVAGNVSGVGLGYVDRTVVNGTTYYYVVSANGADGNGTGATSAEVSATPTARVDDVTATVTNGRILVRWQDLAGARYHVKRAEVSGGPYSTVASSLAADRFTDVHARTCRDYYYVVTIAGADGESPASREVTAKIPGSLPRQYTSVGVGPVGKPGGASFCDGRFEISGSGADIFGRSDAFHFVYTHVPLAANGEVRARVLGVKNTHSNAKAAVMIRETLDPGSRHALVDVQPGAGIEFLYRTETGGSTSSSIVPGRTAPHWVRLTRTNNVFTAYGSPDGAEWNQIGAPVTIAMSGTGAYVGLAVCAHDNSVLNTSLIDEFTVNFPTDEPSGK